MKFLLLFDIAPEMIDAAYHASFDKFILAYKSPEERAINKMKALHLAGPEIGYYNFLNQAYKYHPSFKDYNKRVIGLGCSHKGSWRQQLGFECNIKEIPHIFMHLSTGFYYNKGFLKESKFDYTVF